MRDWLQVYELIHFLEFHLSHVQVSFCLLACPSVFFPWSQVHCETLLQSQEISFLLELVTVLQYKSSHVPVL